MSSSLGFTQTNLIHFVHFNTIQAARTIVSVQKKSGASNPGSVNLKLDRHYWACCRVYRISVSSFFLRIVCTHQMGHINDVRIIQKVSR